MDAQHHARVTICNGRGLHARASARFVKCVEGFDASVSVSRDGQTVGGTSIMGLMMLGAAKGCDVDFVSEGAQAAEVMAALVALVQSGFGEAD